MEENSNLNQKAKTIPYEERKNIILSFTELEIQKFLKNLYQSIEPDYLIEVTQGTREFGKDLVLVRKDRISQHVIGVIVKLGNIRGKSLGDVDLINNRIGQTVTEKVILSQINQAAKNPAELKSSLEDLRINEIKVVIVGEVSNEARTRLRNEIENINIEIYDLHWVIESFTEYYPQIFYGGNLLSFFENEIQNLETNHWLTKKGYNLSEVFVNPMVSTVIVDSYDKLNEFSSNLIEKKKLPFEELKELIFSGEKILLIGEAGTGKTGVLTKIIIDFYNEKVIEMIKNPLLDRKCKIPVFIKCSDYTNKNIDLDSLLQFIPSDIRNNFEIASIMADGFDELAIENRKTVLEKLLTSSNELKSSLILTSRNTQIDSEYFKKLKRYELLPFGLKQSIQMIQGLFKQKDKKNLSQLQKLLLEKLPEIRSVIPLVPMSLILLVELVNEQKEIPASLTELYERYLEQVLGKWDKDKGIQVLFEYQIKDRFLQELAYQKIFLNNSNEINIQREEFNSFVKDYREKYSTWDDDNKFISEINREGILAINEETVSFRHRSFLDYFIGSYFYNNAEDISNLQEELVKTYFDSQWSDTVFYYIGKKRKISKSFLEKIFKYDQIQYINQSKLIIGRLLQAGWHSEKEIKLFGITESIKFAGKTRSDFKELFVNGQKAESPLQMPELLLDILILVLCEHSFESTFIQNEVLQIIKEKIKTKNFDSYLEIIGLISSINRFLDSSHREMLLTKVIDLFKEGKLFKEDELRYLFLLDIIEKDNKDMKKIIKKRIKKKLKFKEKKPSFLG